MILDEVQSGFGRTGKFFALEHFSVQPDILVMAKGLASGLPLSGIAAPLAMMAQWLPGSHGGTYGGNAVAAAAATATIDVICEEKLADNAAARGQQLQDGLAALARQYPLLGDVRGLGLMIGVEFSQPGSHQPAPEMAKSVQKACLARDLLLLTCGTYGNVIRWIPPLVVDAAQIETGLGIFAAALAEATG